MAPARRWATAAIVGSKVLLQIHLKVPINLLEASRMLHCLRFNHWSIYPSFDKCRADHKCPNGPLQPFQPKVCTHPLQVPISILWTCRSHFLLEELHLLLKVAPNHLQVSTKFSVGSPSSSTSSIKCFDSLSMITSNFRPIYEYCSTRWSLLVCLHPKCTTEFSSASAVQWLLDIGISSSSRQ